MSPSRRTRRGRDAVDDLLVDRGAERGGEAPVALEGRDGAHLPGPPLGVGVEVPGRDARRDERDELGEDPGHDPASSGAWPGSPPRSCRRSCPCARPRRPRRAASRISRMAAAVASIPFPPSTRWRVPFFPVIGQERLRLLRVDPEALPDDLGPVVLAPDERPAAGVADALPGRLPDDQVEHGAAVRAGPPARRACGRSPRRRRRWR